MKLLLQVVFFVIPIAFQAQVTLEANGAGQTYELISSVLAPGYNPIESPGEMVGTCDNHSTSGRHISEVFDVDLDKNVFKFTMHVNDDNDRCKNFDRQRNEIKTFASSPDNLLGVSGETVLYQWKFKLDANFQASSSFTHLHQLKAVGGPEDKMPTITFTARKSSPDRLEVRYAQNLTQTTIKTADLSLFKGKWIEVIEIVEYGESGSYDLVMKDVATGNEVLTYSNNSIRMWKTDANFLRPKWGIYRSLNNSADLRDEELLYADFKIEENPTLSIGPELQPLSVKMYPNPAKDLVYLESLEAVVSSDTKYALIDISGKVVRNNISLSDTPLNISDLRNGIYFLSIWPKSTTFSGLKLIKK